MGPRLHHERGEVVPLTITAMSHEDSADSVEHFVEPIVLRLNAAQPLFFLLDSLPPGIGSSNEC